MNILKKITALFCSGIVLASGTMPCAAADKTPDTVKFTVSTVQTAPGKTVKFSIKVENTARGISAYGLKLTYDAGLIFSNYDEKTPEFYTGAAADGIGAHCMINPKTYSVAIVSMNDKASVKSGDLVTFPITVPKDAKHGTKYKLTLAVDECWDKDNEAVATKITNGCIEVLNPAETTITVKTTLTTAPTTAKPPVTTAVTTTKKGSGTTVNTGSAKQTTITTDTGVITQVSSSGETITTTGSGTTKPVILTTTVSTGWTTVSDVIYTTTAMTTTAATSATKPAIVITTSTAPSQTTTAATSATKPAIVITTSTAPVQTTNAATSTTKPAIVITTSTATMQTTTATTSNQPVQTTESAIATTVTSVSESVETTVTTTSPKHYVILKIQKPMSTSEYSVKKIDLHADGSYTVCPEEEQDVRKGVHTGGVIGNGNGGYELIPQPAEYILPDDTKAYLIQFHEKTDADIMLSMQNHLLHLESSNTDAVIFDLKGYCKFSGDQSAYNFIMVSNDGFAPTDWHQVEIAGNGSEFIYSMAEKGYFFTADQLNDITVSATGKTSLAACRFSSDSRKAFIYEIAEDQIGILEDKDGDGICEMPCTAARVTHHALGEVDNNPGVSVEDAQLTLNAYADIVAGLECTLRNKANADINGDKQITVEDAQLILLYYVNNTLSGIPTAWDDLLGKKN